MLDVTETLGSFGVSEVGLTFDWRGRQVSEEAHCHLQDVCFLQFGVARVVFADERQDEALQVSETVIDASSSPLLQQGFQSLEERIDKIQLIPSTFSTDRDIQT